MPQSCCLKVHVKCDLEQESKQGLEIWNLGKVTHIKEYETKMMN